MALALLWTGAAAHPAAASAGTCSMFWTGATDTSWTVPTNWAATAAGTGTGRVPLGTDMACMATAPARTTVEYFSYNRTVAGINFGVQDSIRPTLRVHGGVLTVGSAGGSFDSVINNLELLEGGVLRGTADHTLTGAPSLTDNAILEGGGTTTLVTGMNVATNGLVVSDGRRLVVEGQLTHDGCYDFVYLYNGGVLQNAGRLVAASDCGMQIYSDGTNGSKIVNDAGATIQVTQAAAATYHLTGPFENHGRVEVPNGSLVLRPLGSPDGSYHLGSNARLLVAPGGGLWIRPGTLSGGQTVVVTGGRVHVDPAVSVASIDVQSGLLTGNPTVTTLTAAPGATITGGGTVTVAPSGTATIDGLVIDGGADLRNLGTMTHVDCTAPIDLRKGATLINEGVWKLPCGSTVEGDGSSGVLVRNAAGGLIDGELPGTAQEYHFNTRTTNDGQVEMAKGRIEFANLTNLASGRLTGGNYVVTGGVLQVPGNIVTNAGTIRIATPGDLVTPAGTRALLQLQTNSGSLNLNQLLTPQTQVTNTGTITVTANTFKPKSYRQTAGNTIVQSGATLAAADGPGAIDIDGGTLSGPGRVGSIDGAGTIRPAMTLTVNGQYNPTPSGVLEIDIGGPGNAGKLAVAGNATLNGTLRLDTAAGYTPARGATFTVVTMSFRSGTFTTVTGVNLPGGNYYAVTYGATSITITVKQLSQVTAADGQALVGPAGDTPMTFDVALDEPSTQDVTVAYETVEETASAMLDFLPASGVLVFPPGVQQQTIVVTIVKDLLPEPQETFALVLSDPVGGELARGAATGRIDHEQEAPTAPVVTGVSGVSIGLGAYQVQRTITGEHFLESSVVTLAGTGLRLDASQYVDATTIAVTLSGTAATTTGANDVTVTNPGLGADTCQACLTVTQRPQPEPGGQWLAVGATDVVLPVTGTDFEPGSTARLTGGSGLAASSRYVSSTTLELTVTVYDVATLGPWDIRVTNPDDGLGVCTGCFTVVPGPTLTGMDPAVAARGSAQQVTLSGSGFVTGASLVSPMDVSFGGVQVVDDTTITATMTVSATRAKGPEIPVTVVNPATAGSGSARCGCLEVATLISAADISPRVGSAGPVEAAFEVRLDAPSGVETTVDYTTVDGTAVAGADYEPASGTLSFPPNTTSLSVTVIVLPGADAAPAQAFGLALSGPVNARLATTMAIATIEYDDDAVPAPELTGLTPGTVGIGAPARVLTLHGQRFHPTSTVAVSGRGVVLVSTQYVDQATLRVSLNAWATAEAGPRDVTVTTPGAGSSTCTGCLWVTPAPAATGAAPALATGATERVITVSGTGFAPGAKPAFVGGSGVGVRSTEYMSSAALRVTVSVAQTATVGDYDIKVTNLDGGTTMCLDCYRVLAGPTVVAMTPPLVLRGSTLPVVITGTGFVNGVTVQGPAGVRFTNVTAVDSTTITAVISVELTRGRGLDLPITVVNPASAGWGQGTGRCLGITV